MEKNVFMYGRDYNKFVQFFNLKQDFTLEELECAKYIKQQENKEDSSIEEKYQILLSNYIAKKTNIKLNEIDSIFVNGVISDKYFDQYKQEYISQYQKKYCDIPQSIKNNQFNENVKEVSDITTSYSDKLASDDQISFKKDIEEFYNQYFNKSKELINNLCEYRKQKLNGKASTFMDNLKDYYLSMLPYESLNNILNDEKFKTYYNNERSLLQNLNMYFLKLDVSYKDTKVQDVLEVFYKKIDEFLINLAKEIEIDVHNNLYTDKEQIDEKYNELISKVDNRVKIFDDEIKNKLKIALTGMVKTEKEIVIPRKELLNKINLASSFENYNEVLNILMKIEEKNNKEISVIPVNR